MTNKEKFKEVFGLEIDDTSDCGFFDCTDRECKDCPVRHTKDWWNSEYLGGEMKGRFDLFTDGELYMMGNAFSDKSLWSLLGEVGDELKRRNEMSSVDRKVYDSWRGKIIKRCMKEEKSE